MQTAHFSNEQSSQPLAAEISIMSQTSRPVENQEPVINHMQAQRVSFSFNAGHINMTAITGLVNMFRMSILFLMRKKNLLHFALIRNTGKFILNLDNFFYEYRLDRKHM